MHNNKILARPERAGQLNPTQRLEYRITETQIALKGQVNLTQRTALGIKTKKITRPERAGQLNPTHRIGYRITETQIALKGQVNLTQRTALGNAR